MKGKQALITQYHQAVEEGDIKEDKEQLTALSKLQRVIDELGIKQSWWQQFLMTNAPVKGLYLFGSVGIGKTYLMDLFFVNVPVKRKLRMHFHLFMREVDQQLRQLQGTPEPLEKVAKRIAKRARVLCFDEFFVHDIADAMILGRLFTALFNHGITLVATSNIPPDKLYWNGLHRKRFLPTISLIQQHCEVYGFESLQDYRLRELLNAGVYFQPLNELAQQKLEDYFKLYSHGNGQDGGSLWVENREIPCIKHAEHVVWFDFDIICNIPRSQLDFLKIAERFPTVLVSSVKAMTAKDTAKITYFIHLVDVFYDQGIQLILSAEVGPEKLYEQGDKDFEFQRALSRLIEMQSVDYIEKATRNLQMESQSFQDDE